MNALLGYERTADRAAVGWFGWAERGWLPDIAVRLGLRRLYAQRLYEERRGGIEAQAHRYRQRLDLLRAGAASLPSAAPRYRPLELPADFFRLCLGPRLKSSCAHFAHGEETLDEAEEAMLSLCAERAELADGQSILELGCGWGSLTSWMAERYPSARITAVSDSRVQGEYVERQCRERGLHNVRVIAEDVNRLELAPEAYDRCVSVEAIERLGNYDALLRRIASWLNPRGKLFVHIYCHRALMSPFEAAGEGDGHFFADGLMPAADTLLWFQRDLHVEDRWLIGGDHYRRTAEHWLRRQDRRRAEALEILARTCGADGAALRFRRWRLVWLACAELFGYADGREWGVAHYRFARTGR